MLRNGDTLRSTNMGQYGTNMDSPLKAIKEPLNAPEWG